MYSKLSLVLSIMGVGLLLGCKRENDKPAESFQQVKATDLGDLRILNTMQSDDGNVHYVASNASYTYYAKNGGASGSWHIYYSSFNNPPAVNQFNAIEHFTNGGSNALSVTTRTSIHDYLHFDSLGFSMPVSLSYKPYYASQIALSPASGDLDLQKQSGMSASPLFVGGMCKLMLMRVGYGILLANPTIYKKTIQFVDFGNYTIGEPLPAFHVWYGLNGFYVNIRNEVYRVEMDGSKQLVRGFPSISYLHHVWCLNGDTVAAFSGYDRSMYLSYNKGLDFSVKYSPEFLIGMRLFKVGSVMVATQQGRIFTFQWGPNIRLTEIQTPNLPLALIVGIYKVNNDVLVFTEAGVYKKSYTRFIGDKK